MPFNIEEFKSNPLFQYGVLRNNQYMVRIPIPQGMLFNPNIQNLQVVDRNIEFACEATNFPMTGVDAHKVRRYGYGALETKPVFPIFSNLQCTFMSDRYSYVQLFFHEWMKLICNYDWDNNINSQTGVTGYTQAGAFPMSVYDLAYKGEYAVNIQLIIFSPDGTLVREVFFRDAYPIMVPDQLFAWGAQNDRHKIPVIFTFFDWQIVL